MFNETNNFLNDFLKLIEIFIKSKSPAELNARFLGKFDYFFFGAVNKTNQNKRLFSGRKLK